MEQSLNSSQQKAVMHSTGPLLIIAGAGTGKTTVITKRIEHLIKEKVCKPDEIVALTFTEKAASEMICRLDEVMPYGYEEPWICTFHGFCDRLLKEDGLDIGLSPDYKILSTAKQWILIKKNIFNLNLNYYAPLGNPNKFISALIKFFSRLQDEDVTESEIDNYLKKIKNENQEAFIKYSEVFAAQKKYQQLKHQENVLDFGDLISLTLKLLRTRNNILLKYQKKFKYILVDEFQDTNFTQLQLIKLLAPPQNSPNLTVVGDDDQAIYAFRGSSVHNILDFKKQYPTAQEVVLTTNYRSGQLILNASYNSIVKNNPDRLEEILKIDKKLVAARGKKLPTPQIIEVDTQQSECDFVVQKILELVGKDFTYKDIAILARANNHLDPFVASFRRTLIPYQLIGNRGLFDQEEVKDLLFFLKIAANPHDDTCLFYFLHTSVFNLTPPQLIQILQEAKTQSVPLWQIITLKSQTDEKFKKIVDLIAEAQSQDTKKSITEITFKFINDSGYIKPLLKEENLENQLKLKNLNLFFERLKEYDTEFKGSSICQAIEYFDLLIEAGENPAQAQLEDIDTVSLLTIHSSKGLEWPIVFLINVVSDRFPSRSQKDSIELPVELIKQTLPKGNEHLQEERRLFYVAVTRARDYFFAVYGKDYGGSRPKKASGFLAELAVDTNNWQLPSGQLSWLSQIQGVTAPAPKRVIDGKLTLNHVSYTQIDVYQTCPLKYKYQYILQVPIRPHHAFSYGTTIHNTLHQFHQFEIKGLNPDLDVLLHIYETNFHGIGYESEQHRLKRYEKGKSALKKYFQTYKNQFLGKPFALEKSFNLQIDGVKIIGRIDRIDKLENGFELVDYKTGSVKDQKTVNKDNQLTLYAMASQALFNEIPDKLSLYFIDDGKKVETVRNQKDIESTNTLIAYTINQIKSGKFEPKANLQICKYCPYNQICPFAKLSQ
jgi:DNA helicase-2/ATP-dependent DNA helicase PcrA